MVIILTDPSMELAWKLNWELEKSWAFFSWQNWKLENWKGTLVERNKDCMYYIYFEKFVLYVTTSTTHYVCASRFTVSFVYAFATSKECFWGVSERHK